MAVRKRPENTPPHSLEAEQALLGAAFISAEALDDASEAGLRAVDFYREAHRLIYEGMCILHDRCEAIDLVTVLEELNKKRCAEKCGGPAYLAELADAVATALNAGHHAEIIKSRAIQRAVSGVGRKMIDMSTTVPDTVELLDEVEAMVFKLRDGRIGNQLKSLGADVMRHAMRGLSDRMTRRREIVGTPSGFADLDKMTAGYHAGDLIILAGRPSMGKTAFALDNAINIAIPDRWRRENQAPRFGVAFFSLEMSTDQLIQRLWSQLASVPLQKLRTGELSQAQLGHLAEASGRITQAPLLVDETAAQSVSELRAKARGASRRFERDGVALGLVVVDYLQLIKKPKADTRDEAVAEISRGLKSLAKELNVPVLALSQLNREIEKRKDKRPILSDLRESGAIEQDADLILFVYRPVVYTANNNDLGKAEIIIGKQRNGPIGTVNLTYQAEYTRFLGKECW